MVAQFGLYFLTAIAGSVIFLHPTRLDQVELVCALPLRCNLVSVCVTLSPQVEQQRYALDNCHSNFILGIRYTDAICIQKFLDL